MELTSALKATKTLKAFVEKGQMEEAVGAISITAVLDAFKKAVRANDPRSQMWSAISHLEQAKAAFRKTADKRILSYLVMSRYSEANINYVYVLCLTSVLYRYLGEFALSGEALDRAISRYNAVVIHINKKDGSLEDGKYSIFQVRAITNHPMTLSHAILKWIKLKITGKEFYEGRRIDPHELKTQLEGMRLE